jgi:hypothetical protein
MFAVESHNNMHVHVQEEKYPLLNEERKNPIPSKSMHMHPILRRQHKLQVDPVVTQHSTARQHYVL